MRFLLRMLAAVVLAVAIFLGIAAWHVTLAAMVILFALPVLMAAACFWNKPFVFIVCAALVALFWVDISALSYFKAPRSSFGMDQTNYSLKWDQGRLLAFAFADWPSTVVAQTVTEAPAAEDWWTWSGFFPPSHHFRLLGLEFARGEYIVPFSLREGQQQVVNYRMIGVPAWLTVCLLVGPALLRLYFWQPWFGRRSGGAHEQAGLNEGEAEASAKIEGAYDWTKSREAPGILVVISLAVTGIAGSVILFLIGLLIELVRLGFDATSTPIPLSLCVWSYGLSLLSACSALFVSYPVEYVAARMLSIWRYAVIGGASLVFAADFLCARFWPWDAANDPLETVIFPLRLSMLFCLFLCVILPSLSWRWATTGVLRGANVALATCFCLVGAFFVFVDFRMLDPGLRVGIYSAFSVMSNAYLLGQILYLGRQKSRTPLEGKLAYLTWATAIAYWISLCVLDGNPSPSATTFELAQCVWEMRLLMLLGFNGGLIHLLSRPTPRLMDGIYRLEV